MNYRLITLFVAIGFNFACERSDPCSDLVDGIYIFPDLPENHTMTSQEITEYWDLPEDICGCITTKGLIETCLKYPELGLIYAGANPQSGYDLLIKERFRGIRELETRSDRGTFLLKKYQSINPLGYNPDWEPVKIGEYILNIITIEIISSQYVNLEPLTKEETIELTETVLDVYDKEISHYETYGQFGLECSMALAGRLMYLNGFGRIVDLYDQSSFARELLDFYGPTSMETVGLIYSYTKEFLTDLKSK